ncbi:hypothetical protein NXS19_013708 [Fusarium pseudograminearum]|nr:hypothetical protein NXS19_013708 [Fusarium pseudograminearum]
MNTAVDDQHFNMRRPHNKKPGKRISLCQDLQHKYDSNAVKTSAICIIMSASFYSHQNPIQDALAVYQTIGYRCACTLIVYTHGWVGGRVREAGIRHVSYTEISTLTKTSLGSQDSNDFGQMLTAEERSLHGRGP